MNQTSPSVESSPQQRNTVAGGSPDSFPRISIVTPSYNQGHFLEQTLRSVLDQGYPNLEYIVIDGGSKDNSVEIIKKYADRLAYWVSEKDQGLSDAINKGYRRATGSILGWTASDDLYCPGSFMRVVQFFRDHPECGAVVGDMETIDEESRVIFSKKSVPVNFRRALYSGSAVPDPATFYTREAWDIAGELDITLPYLMDYEHYLRMLSRGVRFGLIKATLAQFRLQRDSKTISGYERMFWPNFCRVQDLYLKVPLQGAARDWYRRRMSFLYHLQIFLLRAVTRGEFVPFRDRRARRQATPQK